VAGNAQITKEEMPVFNYGTRENAQDMRNALINIQRGIPADNQGLGWGTLLNDFRKTIKADGTPDVRKLELLLNSLGYSSPARAARDMIEDKAFVRLMSCDFENRAYHDPSNALADKEIRNLVYMLDSAQSIDPMQKTSLLRRLEDFSTRYANQPVMIAALDLVIARRYGNLPALAEKFAEDAAKGAKQKKAKSPISRNEDELTLLIKMVRAIDGDKEYRDSLLTYTNMRMNAAKTTVMAGEDGFDYIGRYAYLKKAQPAMAKTLELTSQQDLYTYLSTSRFPPAIQYNLFWNFVPRSLEDGNGLDLTKASIASVAAIGMTNVSSKVPSHLETFYLYDYSANLNKAVEMMRGKWLQYLIDSALKYGSRISPRSMPTQYDTGIGREHFEQLTPLEVLLRNLALTLGVSKPMVNMNNLVFNPEFWKDAEKGVNLLLRQFDPESLELTSQGKLPDISVRVAWNVSMLQDALLELVAKYPVSSSNEFYRSSWSGSGSLLAQDSGTGMSRSGEMTITHKRWGVDGNSITYMDRLSSSDNEFTVTAEKLEAWKRAVFGQAGVDIGLDEASLRRVYGYFHSIGAVKKDAKGNLIGLDQSKILGQECFVTLDYHEDIDRYSAAYWQRTPEGKYVKAGVTNMTNSQAMEIFAGYGTENAQISALMDKKGLEGMVIGYTKSPYGIALLNNQDEHQNSMILSYSGSYGFRAGVRLYAKGDDRGGYVKMVNPDNLSVEAAAEFKENAKKGYGFNMQMIPTADKDKFRMSASMFKQQETLMASLGVQMKKGEPSMAAQWQAKMLVNWMRNAGVSDYEGASEISFGGTTISMYGNTRDTNLNSYQGYWDANLQRHMEYLQKLSKGRIGDAAQNMAIVKPIRADMDALLTEAFNAVVKIRRYNPNARADRKYIFEGIMGHSFRFDSKTGKYEEVKQETASFQIYNPLARIGQSVTVTGGMDKGSTLGGEYRLITGNSESSKLYRFGFMRPDEYSGWAGSAAFGWSNTTPDRPLTAMSDAHANIFRATFGDKGITFDAVRGSFRRKEGSDKERAKTSYNMKGAWAGRIDVPILGDNLVRQDEGKYTYVGGGTAWRESRMTADGKESSGMYIIMNLGQLETGNDKQIAGSKDKIKTVVGKLGYSINSITWDNRTQNFVVEGQAEYVKGQKEPQKVRIWISASGQYESRI
jgi:hypothetical protein